MNSEQMYDSIFLSYRKILVRLNEEKITTKNGKPVTYVDLKFAINVMLQKHKSCRWRSEIKESNKYYVLIEGYAWLIQVYFQKEKLMLDADVEFFKDRIKKYEDLLKIEPKENFIFCDMSVNELMKYFNRNISTIRKSIRRMCKSGYLDYKYYQNGKVIISSIGVEWLCKNVFKRKYLELLEQYKMELTEKYIDAGYPYDDFFGKN